MIFDEYAGQVVPIRYHTWWPRYADPFYQFDSLAIRYRVQTYYGGIIPWTSGYYVPSFRFDGKYIKDPSDFGTYPQFYAFMRHTLDSLAAIGSPIRIDLDFNAFSADSDSVYVSFDVVAEGDAAYNMALYLVVNETRHGAGVPYGPQKWPFRHFYPDTLGHYLAPMTAGDSLHFDWGYEIDPAYIIDRVVTNIWVQRDGTRKVQQAISQMPADALAGVEIADIPDRPLLGRNVPNPFVGETQISYTMRSGGQVRLSVYTLSGRLVTDLVNGYSEVGSHSVGWDGRDRFGREVASGVYYYVLGTEKASQAGKMILLR